MNEPTPERPRPRRPRRRWFQFGLRTLLLVTLTAAVFFAWWARPERLVEFRAAAAEALERIEGK